MTSSSLLETEEVEKTVMEFINLQYLASETKISLGHIWASSKTLLEMDKEMFNLWVIYVHVWILEERS